VFELKTVTVDSDQRASRRHGSVDHCPTSLAPASLIIN